MRRSARLPKDSEDDGVISLRACKKFRRCKTRLGCSGVSCGPGGEDCDELSLGTLLFNSCCGDEMVVDDEGLLSTAAAGAIGSESVGGKDSSFGRFLSNCCCSDEMIIDEGDSALIGAIGISDKDVNGPSMAAAVVLGDSDEGLAIGGWVFQGSSTCSLTESNAADTQRSERQQTQDKFPKSGDLTFKI